MGDRTRKTRQNAKELGVDYAFEFIGLPETQTQAIRSVKKGGNVAIVGIPRQSLQIYVTYLLSNEIQLGTSFDHTRAEIDYVVRLVNAGRLDLSKSISHRFPLDKVNEGIEVLARKTSDPVRVILLP